MLILGACLLALVVSWVVIELVVFRPRRRRAESDAALTRVSGRVQTGVDPYDALTDELRRQR